MRSTQLNNELLECRIRNSLKLIFDESLVKNNSAYKKKIESIFKKNGIDYKNDDEVKRYIKHNFISFLADNKKSDLGKYYTPPHLVNLIKNLASPYLIKKSYVLDLAAGCGAFLDLFNNNFIIARDIDPIAVNVLSLLGYRNVDIDNSLLNVHRKKYNLKDNDRLVIIGNPPYNDSTSKNKKSGSNAKQKVRVDTDNDVKSNDLGMSFLKAFDKLKADVICVLHPLSYLIKRANFDKLGNFKNQYKLIKGIIFSSNEFSDTQKTPFPIVAALYIRDLNGMKYKYIFNFKFGILNSEDNFILKYYETIDDYIRKYPPTQKEKSLKSDIGLYMHNIRDTNSLITSGYLTEKHDPTRNITINFNDLYKYAYLNCMRRYFLKDFKFGNLSPIVKKNELENNAYLQDLCIIDTIINNQKLMVFNVDNRSSIIWTRGLYESYNSKKDKCLNTPNIYNIFLNFMRTKQLCSDSIKMFLINYFENLKNLKDNYIEFDKLPLFTGSNA